MASSHPSFLLVPGAWHQPAIYDNFVALLKKAGHSVVVLSLPSCDTQDPQNVTCTTDAQAIREQIVHSIEADEKDIVLVCHSYGGIPGGGSARGLSTIARAREGKKGGVVGLVYVCGFVVPGGSNLVETLGGKHAPYVDADQPSEGQSIIKGARDVLFNDLDESEADRLTRLLRPTSMRAFDSPAPPQAWAEPEFEGKLAFVRCLLDQAVPPFLQDMFVERSGVQWDVKNVETSHSPFASKPEELVSIFTELAREFVRRGTN